MDIEEEVTEVQLRECLKRAHLGDLKAKNQYEALLEEAEESANSFWELYLYYMREVVLRELLEEYVDGLESDLRRSKRMNTILKGIIVGVGAVFLIYIGIIAGLFKADIWPW